MREAADPTLDAASPPDAADLLTQAEAATALARRLGADDAVASAAWRREVEHRWRDGRLEAVHESASRGLHVEIHLDGRWSSHATNDLDPARLEHFLAEAVALTRHLEPDPHRRMTDPALYAPRAEVELDLVDPAVSDLPGAERLARCRALAAAAGAHDDVVSASAMVHSAHEVMARAATNGFTGTHAGTVIGQGADVTLREGAHKRPEDHWYATAAHLEDLPDAAAIGAEALRRARGRLGAAKIPSQRTTLVLEPRAAAGLLGRMFGALTAASIQQRRSFLADALGTRIGAPLLHVTDDPLRPRGLASRTWDGEGIASRPRTVVEDGVLAAFFVDTYYGHKLGWAPTTASPSNVVFRLGAGDTDALSQAVGNGVRVTSWLGGNADPTTGDFSMGLRGHRIRGGAVAEPVSEMNLTGSFLDLLGRLAAVGDDPLPWAVFRTPTLVFEGLELSGS